MKTSNSATRELYERLAATPERRRSIAERIFRQLRNSSDSDARLGGFSPVKTAQPQ